MFLLFSKTHERHFEFLPWMVYNRMMKRIFLSASALWFVASLHAAPTLKMTLTDAEKAALTSSPRVQSSQAQFEAAQSSAKSQFAALWPKISFDASYRYVSEVPLFAPIPNAPPIKFGDNKNYSYGPALSWLIWDTGGLYHRWKNAQAQAAFAKSQLDVTTRQLLLEVRMDYFQAQLQLEQVRLLSESLKLAQAQYNDISLRQRAGTVSRLDSLSSHQEVLDRRRTLRQAQADLAAGLRALFAVTGSSSPAEPTVPWEESSAEHRPADTDEPTLLVSFDPIGDSEIYLQAAAARAFDASHPQLVSLSDQIDALQQTLNAVKSGYGPTVQLSAKTSRDYPNGPVLESIHQNTVGVSASWPLFEFGRTPDQTAEQKGLIRSLEKQREQTLDDLQRDWSRARDQLAGLRVQQTINEQAVQETQLLQRLTYESYKAGQVNYLDVQTADLRILQSSVEAARNNVEILIQLALLDSLSTKEPSQ